MSLRAFTRINANAVSCVHLRACLIKPKTRVRTKIAKLKRTLGSETFRMYYITPMRKFGAVIFHHEIISVGRTAKALDKYRLISDLRFQVYTSKAFKKNSPTEAAVGCIYAIFQGTKNTEQLRTY